MCSFTGWTWDYVEWHLDLPRLFHLSRQWRDIPPPPVQLLRIAAALGIGAEPRRAPGTRPDDLSQMEPETLAALQEMLPVVQGMPKILTPQEYMERKHGRQ